MTDQPKVANKDLCIIRTRMGERISPEIAQLFDPIDPASLHQYVLPANCIVELHRHEFDEYWWFISGTPVVTLWTEESGTTEYDLGPGDLVACPRGVAHTLSADHEVIYHQFNSILRPGARSGHITDGVPEI